MNPEIIRGSDLMFKLNIKTKIAIVTLTISVVSILAISVLFYTSYKNSLIKSTVDSNSQFTKYISDYLNIYFKKLQYTAVELYNETESVKLKIIKDGYSDNINQKYNQRQSLMNYFTFIQNQRKSIVKTVILSENKTIVETWNRNNIYTKIHLDPIIEKYVYDNNDDSLFSSYSATEIDKQLMMYKKNIYDLFSHEKLGTILYFIDYNKFDWERYNLQDNTFFVVNKYNEIIYHPNREQLGKSVDNNIISLYSINEKGYSLQHNDNQLINYNNLLEQSDLKLINITMMNELKKNKTMAMLATVLVVITAIILSSFASSFFALKITKPIKNLCNTMKKVEKGNFNIKIPETRREDEIAILNKSFNYMTLKIKEMIQFQYQLEVKNREAQLMVLQSQINPHFLYNTLQTISGKAILNNDYEISTMCKALSDIFRYSIQSEPKETTIKDELFHISNYLYIQQIRFDNTIEINIDIDEKFKSCLVPRFILQPIVENAIVHGIEKHPIDKEIISINIEQHNNTLSIIIEDNGPGIEDTKLCRIKRSIDREPMETSSGLTGRSSIGLRNVNTRLKIFYGKQYGINIHNKNTGLKIIMTMPYNKEVTHV